MAEAWPKLDYDASKASLLTLQLWSQMVGKVRLALTPWLNHSWHVPLYVNARGLGTSAIPYRHDLFEIDFNLSSTGWRLGRAQGRKTASGSPACASPISTTASSLPWPG